MLCSVKCNRPLSPDSNSKHSLQKYFLYQYMTIFSADSACHHNLVA